MPATSATSQAEQPTATATHARLLTQPPFALSLMRAAWVIITLLSLSLLMQALPTRLAQLQQLPPTPDTAKVYQLDVGEAALLNQYNVSLLTYGVYNLIFEIVQIGTFVAVGGWLFFTRSHEPGALLVSLTLVMNGIFAPAPIYALVQNGEYPPLLLILETTRRILTVFFVYTFPNGQFVPGWTRWIALLWSFAILLLPFAAGSPATWSPLLQGTTVILWLGPSLAAQFYRYHRVSTPEQRQQAKWFMFGLSVIMAGAVVRGLLLQFVPALSVPGAVRLLFYTLIAVPIFDTMFFITLPFAIGIAVARHRLYGLGLVINRSLVYLAVTVTLLLVFVIVFFLIQGIIQLIGGTPTLALVIASLITAASFNPMRVRLRHFIDHRFFRLRSDLNEIAALERARVSAKERATPVDAVLPRSIGVYQLQERIGKGGMGDVYRAQHSPLGQPVAIKILSEMLVGDSTFRARFEREAQIVAGLRHPNIVQMYDLGNSDGVYYLAMEYIEGEEVGKLLKSQEKLSLEHTRAIIRDVAAALDYAHANGLVHRDVKPSNIMLRRSNGQAVLMDFGVAKLLSDTQGLTSSGMMGTLDYASPEQILSSNVVDHRADIYALGVMTYQLLTGRLPFSGTVGQVLFAHLQQPAPNARQIDDLVPVPVANAILKAMSKQPEDRFQHAGDFTRALDEAG